jgi:type II secretory pathway pseudopilin PulG
MRYFEIAPTKPPTAQQARLTSLKQRAEIAKQAVDAERKAQAKLKPRSRKPLSIPKAPSSPTLKKPKPPLTKQPTPTPIVPNPNKANTITPVRSTVKTMPTTQPQAIPQLKPLPNTVSKSVQNTPNTPKDGYLDKNIGVIKKDDDGDDRHSKNGIRTLKKIPRNFQHPST